MLHIGIRAELVSRSHRSAWLMASWLETRTSAASVAPEEGVDISVSKRYDSWLSSTSWDTSGKVIVPLTSEPSSALPDHESVTTQS